MNCYRCPVSACDTRLCPHGPILHVRLLVQREQIDPNIAPAEDGERTMRTLRPGDIIALEAEEARAWVAKGWAEEYNAPT